MKQLETPVYRQVILLAFALFGCQSEPEVVRLSSTQKLEIEKASKALVASINNYDYDLINALWSDLGFKERLRGITRTQQSVFEHLFKSKIRMMIKSGNLSMVNSIFDYGGELEIMSIEHFDSYSELNLLLTDSDFFEFFKYRVEWVDNKPALVDYKNIRNDQWFSESIVDDLKLNSKYNAFSTERAEANRAMLLYESAKDGGNYQEALEALELMPVSHRRGDWYRLMRIEMSMLIGDPIFSSVLQEEYNQSKGLYIQYLHFLNKRDTIGTQLIRDKMALSDRGATAFDSLIQAGAFWY